MAADQDGNGASGRLHCFKAYDIRGRVPDELNPGIARRIGRAFADWGNLKRVAVGFDIRLTSREMAAAVGDGLREAGCDIVNIGCCGTEEIYFATGHLGLDGGVVITASHNPKDYNGMKFVQRGARPIDGDTDLREIQDLAEAPARPAAAQRGSAKSFDARDAYIAHLLHCVNRTALRPLKIVANPGNGGAGLVIDALTAHLPFEWVKVHFEADGRFPHGVPNPLLPETRAVTAQAVQDSGADLGLAWDGDFDRCFLFDEQGRFVEGYYIVGLLAEAMLRKHAGASIVHDPRLTWNTLELVREGGGRAVQSKTGHGFIKAAMRREDAVYGGEMSAHHYFRDFYYCDSGMLSWLLVAELMGRSGQSLSQMIDERAERFPVSGEINRRLRDPAAALAEIEQAYAGQARSVEHMDGLSMSFADWRFNLRASNTEPVVRLNVETRADRDLLQSRTDEILQRLVAHALED